jgi:DNA-binding MarR family transcriptional regulator
LWSCAPRFDRVAILRFAERDRQEGFHVEAGGREEELREQAVARVMQLFPLLVRRWTRDARSLPWPQELAGGALDAAALRIIQEQDRITAGELARRLWVSESAATAVINRLETHGLVVRQREPTDRRVVHLSLTPRGDETLCLADRMRAHQVREWFRPLNVAEIHLLADLMEKMLQGPGER